MALSFSAVEAFYWASQLRSFNAACTQRETSNGNSSQSSPHKTWTPHNALNVRGTDVHGRQLHCHSPWIHWPLTRRGGLSLRACLTKNIRLRQAFDNVLYRITVLSSQNKTTYSKQSRFMERRNRPSSSRLHKILRKSKGVSFKSFDFSRSSCMSASVTMQWRTRTNARQTT